MPRKFLEFIFTRLPRPLFNRLIRGSYAEHAWCLLLKPRRLSLPKLTPSTLWSEFDQTEVRITKLPQGGWASPVVDLVVLSKIVACIKPKKALEMGAFRGYTSMAIARHLPQGGKLVAVDIATDHGEAYRGLPEAELIERRVGALGPAVFSDSDHASFDLIFVDADHRYDAVRHDTELAFQLLKPQGLLIWHDYANWGFFSKACGVPEFLDELASDRPVVHIAGSNMAVHCPAWLDQNAKELQRALTASGVAGRGNIWTASAPRP